MKRFFTLAAVFSALTSAVFAAPTKMGNAPAKATKSSAIKCPQCKMPLTTKADKMHTVAVKMNGKTYYCCAACGAHKAAGKGAKATAKDSKKKVASMKCPNCGMTMTTTKGGPMYSTPMKVNGVTYYCCPACQKQ